MILQQITSTVDGDTTVYLIAAAGLAGPIGILRLDPAGFVRSLFVTEECRGRGYGTALLKRACELCEQLGCQTIGLSVANNNPRASELYQRLGFRKYIEGHEGYTQFVKALND